MKKLLLFIIVSLPFLVAAQPKLFFSYDASGNQIVTSICINCPNTFRTANPNSLTKDDLVKSEVSDKISYYPNPVSEELFVKWELIDDKKVESITVFDLNGALLQTYLKPKSEDLTVIPFGRYPVGLYSVVLEYSDGESKALKIVKQ
jgi:hypothetical protein